MVFSLVVDEDRDGRKGLGQKENKVIENKLDKLLLYDSRHSCGGFNIRQVEGLFNLEFSRLTPSDFVKIFAVLRRNLYYEENLYQSLYRSLANKITYFNTDELIHLVECVSPFSVVKHNFGYLSSFSDKLDKNTEVSENELCEISSLESRTEDFYQVQNEVLSKVIDVIEYKIKFKEKLTDEETFYFNSRCIETLNKFTFLDRWSVLMELSEGLSNQLVSNFYQGNLVENSNSISLDNVLKTLNNIADSLSMKSMDLMCRNIEENRYKLLTHNIVDFVNLSLIEHRDIMFSYFSSGDIQILSLLENYHEGLRISVRGNSISPQLVEELITMFKIFKKMHIVFTFLKGKSSNLTKNPGNVDYFLLFNFKLWNIGKFLKSMDKEVFCNTNGIEDISNQMAKFIPEFFIERRELISPKNHGILLSMLSECSKLQTLDFPESDQIPTKEGPEYSNQGEFEYSGYLGAKDKENSRVLDAVRRISRTMATLTNISSIDRLNVLESSYNSFGYVNHYTTKKFLDHILNQFPKNPLDSIVMLRTLFFSFKLPFNLVCPERNNIRKSLDFLASSKLGGYTPSFKSLEFHLNRTILRPKNQSGCQFDNVSPLKWDLGRVKMYTSSILGQNLTKTLKNLKFLKM